MMQIQTIEGLSMGGNWRLRLAGPGPDARGSVQGALDLVEGQMSAWIADSDLCRINEAAVGDWVTVAPEIGFVIAAGLDLMGQASGAFSILLGGAQAREGFVPGRVCGISSDPAMVEVDGLRVRRRADVTLDLNAIAKGFAADLAARALVRAGYEAFLLEVAGDIVARGLRPDGLAWTVALELPIPDRIVPARLIPVQGGIATSGGYRRARGVRSHILSPVTGQPLAANAGSVAVLAATAMQADGWATVLAVLGPEKGLEFAAARGLAAVFIEQSEGGFVERGSPAMAALLAVPEPA